MFLAPHGISRRRLVERFGFPALGEIASGEVVLKLDESIPNASTLSVSNGARIKTPEVGVSYWFIPREALTPQRTGFTDEEFNAILAAI